MQYICSNMSGTYEARTGGPPPYLVHDQKYWHSDQVTDQCSVICHIKVFSTTTQGVFAKDIFGHSYRVPGPLESSFFLTNELNTKDEGELF